jgi:hypothetical protein
MKSLTLTTLHTPPSMHVKTLEKCPQNGLKNLTRLAFLSMTTTMKTSSFSYEEDMNFQGLM